MKILAAAKARVTCTLVIGVNQLNIHTGKYDSDSINATTLLQPHYKLTQSAGAGGLYKIVLHQLHIPNKEAQP